MHKYMHVYGYGNKYLHAYYTNNNTKNVQLLECIHFLELLIRSVVDSKRDEKLTSQLG